MNQAELKKIIHYDPLSGIFTWKSIRSRRIKAGDRAANPKGGGYCFIQFEGESYLAHRLAWLYVHGKFPDQIDHINHNPADNRIVNLRASSYRVNAKNRTLSISSSTGIYGVRFRQDKNRWVSTIGIDGTQWHLGQFDNFFDACCCRKAAERKHNFHPNHGNPPADN